MTNDDQHIVIGLEARWDVQLHAFLQAWSRHARDQAVAALHEQADKLDEPTRELLSSIELLGTENVTPQAYAAWHALCMTLAESGNTCAAAAAGVARYLALRSGQELRGWHDLPTDPDKEGES